MHVDANRASPEDGDKKPCPHCRQTLVFLGRYPVLGDKAGAAPKEPATRVRYEGVWICTNAACNRREFVTVQDVPDPLAP